MIYSEAVANNLNHGIYWELTQHKKFDLNIVNDLVTADYLDKGFYFHNGDKTIQKDNLTLSDYSDIVLASYYDKWKTYINVLLDNEFKNGISSRSETTTTGTVTNTNKVSAYDSNDLIDDSAVQQNNNITATTTLTTQDSTLKMLNVYQKYSVYAMIETDIRKTLFNIVYN